GGDVPVAQQPSTATRQKRPLRSNWWHVTPYPSLDPYYLPTRRHGGIMAWLNGVIQPGCWQRAALTIPFLPPQDGSATIAAKRGKLALWMTLKPQQNDLTG
ncbi:MAG TPA: hypothetical protein VJM82_08235, partial [Nitrospiraceae bacterium]|nr:hypothetical protein [Nitrospiraceae bacterium]